MSENPVINQLRPEYLGINSLIATANQDSSSRGVMVANHITQRLVIDGADEKYVQTGVEQEFGKYTFSIKMPENGKILKTIQRYPRRADINSLNFNPETLVIYEIEETNTIDVFSIPHYASFHQFFGFKYDIKETINELRPGNYVSKDTIFADSPAVGDNNGYKYGVNLNIALASFPGASEDGIVISEDALDKLKFKVFETRSVEFGSNNFPLNLYGTINEYKPFPEIGDMIGKDGILMMLRNYDNDLMPVEISVFDTMEPDFIFDKSTYVRGEGGRIVDIKVIKNNSVNQKLPDQMCGQIEKYRQALLSFYQQIVDTEQELRKQSIKKYGSNQLKITPRLNRLIVESLAIVNHEKDKFKQNLNLLYRKDPIDEYRIEFVIEYEITPGIGFKLTDGHGPEKISIIYF